MTVFNLSKIFAKIKPDKEYLGCKYLHYSLFFDYENNVRLCPKMNNNVVISSFNGLWLDINKINSYRDKNIELMQHDNTAEICKNCCYRKVYSWKKNTVIKSLYLSHWRFCYINCRYCNNPKEENLIDAKHYDIFPIIKQLIDEKLINTETEIVFECGDASVHPEFDKLMYFFINYETKKIIINTAGLRYCQSIADAIAKNTADVIVSLDSGCAYIYEKIKGLNKFDIALNNIKRYLSYEEPSKKHVIVKYTLIKGINDNEKEVLDWFILSRDILGVKKLALDIEENWFNEVKNSIPKYLQEIILFVKKISDFNDLEIVFYDRVSIMYNSIKKNIQ